MGLIIDSRHVSLGNSQSDSIREALSQRTRRHFNPVCVVILGVTRSDRINLAESLEVVH